MVSWVRGCGKQQSCIPSGWAGSSLLVQTMERTESEIAKLDQVEQQCTALSRETDGTEREASDANDQEGLLPIRPIGDGDSGAEPEPEPER